MRRDGEDGDLAAGRTVTPEDTVCARCAVLGIGLKHLRPGIEGAFEGMIGMGLESLLLVLLGVIRDCY